MRRVLEMVDIVYILCILSPIAIGNAILLYNNGVL